MPIRLPAMRVIHSLLHADDIARLVEREYSVTLPVTATLLSRGFNDTYLVADSEGGHCVLRVYAHDKHWVSSDSDVLCELELLEHLASGGLSVSHPYRQRSGELFGRLEAPEGERCFALFTFAPGVSARERPLDHQQLHAFGAEIARMHVAMDAFRSDHGRYHLDLTNLIDLPLAAIATYAERDRDAYWNLLSVAERLRNYVSALTLSPTAYGLIHGDIHGENLNVTSTGEFVLFDFDLCAFGWRAYDLTNYYAGPNAGDQVRQGWLALLAGYESVRELGAAEREALPAFAACRELWDTGDFLRDAHLFGTAEVTETLCEQLLGRIRERLDPFDW